MAEAPAGQQGRGDVPRPMLTVAAVARRLGVAPATLRTWDRRYGLGPSEHTAGSHRRYSGGDVARLMVMRRLTLDGVPPSEAAAIAQATDVSAEPELASVTSLGPRPNPPEPAARQAGHEPAEDTAVAPSRSRDASPTDDRQGAGLFDEDRESEPGPDTTADDSEQEPHPTAARAGGGRVISLPDGSPAARGLARAAMSLDSHECMRLVRQHIERFGTVRTWEHLIAPVLVAVGDRWRSTGAGVEVEHVLSESILSSLRTVSSGLRHPRNVRPVLLATAENEQHGLPLHVLAAALAEEGVSSRLLGVRVPRSALAAAVRRSGPAVVFVYAHMRVRESDQLVDLPRLRPSPLLLLGGPGWNGVEIPPGAERVDDLLGAAQRIQAAVGG